MKSAKMSTIVVLALGLMVCLTGVSKAEEPMGTAFTYQGSLNDANSPADGLYDFQFKLFDDPCDPCDANQVGGDVNEADIDVIDGYFTVELDFGSAVFDGNARWLNIGVRPGVENDPCSYEVLLPRQELTPTPYALHTRWLLVDTALNNIFAGEGAGTSITTGYSNSAVGANSLSSNTTGRYNSAMGHEALASNTTGNFNSAVGTGALWSNTTGSNNSAVGHAALYNTTTGYYNSAVGKGALMFNTTGNFNSAVGTYALQSNTTGNYNTALGYHANAGNQEGSRNTIIGYHAGKGASAHNKSGNVFLGYRAGYFETGDNKLYIANDWDDADVLIYGDFSTGNVGIGTVSPTAKLHIGGTAGVDGIKFPDGTLQTTASTGGIGDITAVNAGTGLTGGGTSGDVTLDVQVPLDLSGSSSGGIIKGTNNGTGYGVWARATGTSGRGVYGEASNTGNVTNYGGYFRAFGDTGYGVFGWATGGSGTGVYGYAPRYGGHFMAQDWGVWGEASGSNGRGVSGYASDTGSGTNYGGYFSASGSSGRGVSGYASASSGVNYGVYGKTNSSTGYAGYFEGTGYFSGNVGIGTTNPQSKLSVGGNGVANTGVYAIGSTYGVHGEDSDTGSYGRLGYDTYGVFGRGTGHGVIAFCDDGSGPNFAVYAVAGSTDSYNAYGVYSGVHRDGTGNYFSGYFHDLGSGGYYVGLYADYRSGAAIDLAEYILDTFDDTEPADVVVADPDNDESVIKSSIPYDSAVVGIVSTQPHLLMGMELVMNEETGERYEDVDAAMLSLAGRVPVKVTDENGPIERGDLLTTSSKPGYAMKWTLLDVNQAEDFDELKSMLAENERRRNAIVGKAFGNLDSGDGKIMALVNLQ